MFVGMRCRMTTAIIVVFLVIYLNLSTVQCTERKLKDSDLQNKETNTPNFIRLFVMRLIYGLAKSMGLADRLDDFLGGFFVPPGADDYGDEYLDLFGGDY